MNGPMFPKRMEKVCPNVIGTLDAASNAGGRAYDLHSNWITRVDHIGILALLSERLKNDICACLLAETRSDGVALYSEIAST